VIELPRTEWGAGERRALLVHGLGSNAQSWWFIGEQLAADGWHVTAVDLRGHGAAPDAESYALGEYAGDLPNEGWDLVVGHSLGGAAVAVAASAPGFAQRVVLVDPALEFDDATADLVAHSEISELGATAEMIRAVKPHWHERDVEAKAAALARSTRHMLEHTFTQTRPWNFVPEAAVLAVPTLIIGGDPTVLSLFATSTADAMTAANPHIEYRVVAGAGHNPHRDKPQETIAMLRDWLLEH
jgi:pimeloyl-ACP methyl ester carboxylesterase